MHLLMVNMKLRRKWYNQVLHPTQTPKPTDTIPDDTVINIFQPLEYSHEDIRHWVGSVTTIKSGRLSYHYRYCFLKSLDIGDRPEIFFGLNIFWRRKQTYNMILCTQQRLRLLHILISVWVATPQSKQINNDQELTQSDPISCPKNQKGNN